MFGVLLSLHFEQGPVDSADVACRAFGEFFLADIVVGLDVFVKEVAEIEYGVEPQLGSVDFSH